MTRSPMIAAVAAGILIAALPPAVAAAASEVAPCTQWGFNGNTVLAENDGGTLAFTANGQAVSGQATQRFTGGDAFTGTVSGGIDGNAIHVKFHDSTGDFWRFDAGIDPAGSAQGIFTNNAGGGSWQTSAPLTCLA
jgi:hypothetical protein